MAKPMNLIQKLFYHAAVVFLWFTLVPWTRLSARRLLRYWVRPPKGGCLFLCNHVTILDPFIMWCCFPRMVRFMASAHWFHNPILGRLLWLVGSFPKKKFIKDKDAMAAVQTIYDAGEVICIFPEGRRSWDGRTLPVLPRIGRLIKRLDAPVVFCRTLTGHHFRPRWAHHFRWARVRIDYEGPVRFPAEMTEEEIEAEVQRKISIDPDAQPVPWLAWGRHLAKGLDQLLWACPQCLELDAIHIDEQKSNRIRCRACGAGWRVDVAQRLHPLTETPAKRLTVPKANLAIQERFGMPPVADKERLEADGILLEDGQCTLSEIGAKNVRTVRHAGSKIRLYRDRLVVLDDDGGTVWETALVDLVAISIEAGSLLQLRFADDLLELDVVGKSPMKWQHFMFNWREVARQETQTKPAVGG